MSLKRFSARTYSSLQPTLHTANKMSSQYLTDAQLQLLLASYVRSDQLNTWAGKTEFTDAVRRAVRTETMWNDYFSALARRDLLEAVNKEVDGIPKKVKDSMKAQLSEVLKPHLDSFKETIPGHVSRAMIDQAQVFFTSHAQTQELLRRITETLDAKSRETLDRVVQDEKYHEMSGRLEREIQARGDAAIKTFQGEVKTHFQRQNETFGVKLTEMQQQVDAKTASIDTLSTKLSGDEREITDLKSSLRNTQILLGTVTFVGVAGFLWSHLQ